MTRWRWQKITGKGGWSFMATIGQGGGLGISWVNPIRWNGISLLLGPLIIDIQPPAPEWMKGDIKPASNDDSMLTHT